MSTSIDRNIKIVHLDESCAHVQCDQCDQDIVAKPYLQVTFKVTILIKTVDVNRNICVSCAREFKRALSRRLEEIGL